MNFDWQAYLDRSLGAEEMARHEAALQNDPAAAEEVEALGRMRAAFREAILAEPVPVARLEKALRQTVRPAFVWPWRTAALTAVTCAVAAFAFVSLRPVSSVQRVIPDSIVGQMMPTPMIAQAKTSDADAAAEEIRREGGIPAPTIRLTGMGASMTSAECGNCWLAYDYKIGGETYTIIGRKSAGMWKGMQSFDASGKRLYETTDGVGWHCKGSMSYLVIGGNAETRRKIAANACQETDSIRL